MYPSETTFGPGQPERRNLSNDLATAVAAMIHRESLQPGDQLDSVKALAERFQVAVPTMREALRRLEAMGGVLLRHGSGVYVGDNVRRMVLPNPLSPKPTGGVLIELLEARLQIEPPIAALAATVRDPRGVGSMRSTLDEAQRCIAEGDEQLWLVNLNFHRAIAAAGGNTILAEVIDSIVFVHAEEQLEILRLHGDQERDFTEHRQITELIEEGDAQAARRAMAEHLDNVIQIVRRRLSD
ncbi:FadR/GntR family transcriptional regulator [Phytoactinopolyspora halotolerans]|uniref:FadR family transcriptional regulator n=1 Tax=Phytoactinopolyspora halotolerans TaxID=1981512 RepID=A0A6L9S2R5_9ACTN|nr:FCD domain-containing protein [Phytoactinopolyspora halotolerans]NED98727.1 FadR family transcriptional regulator [Phytoactinopolyspora halotolerans]